MQLERLGKKVGTQKKRVPHATPLVGGTYRLFTPTKQTGTQARRQHRTRLGYIVDMKFICIMCVI